MTPRSIRVLLIEDDPDDALLIGEMLAEPGQPAAEVVHEKLLVLGLRRLGRESFDVVLLDMSLPDSWGIQTVRRAKAVAGLVPVILITGAQVAEVADEAREAGAAACLFKNHLDAPALWGAMRAAIDSC